MVEIILAPPLIIFVMSKLISSEIFNIVKIFAAKRHFVVTKYSTNALFERGNLRVKSENRYFLAFCRSQRLRTFTRVSVLYSGKTFSL